MGERRGTLVDAPVTLDCVISVVPRVAGLRKNVPGSSLHRSEETIMRSMTDVAYILSFVG